MEKTPEYYKKITTVMASLYNNEKGDQRRKKRFLLRFELTNSWLQGYGLYLLHRPTHLVNIKSNTDGR